MTLCSRAAVLLLLSVLTGCAGARYQVTAPTARYPLSFSPVLPDANGEPLWVGHGLVEKASFEFSDSSLGFLFGLSGAALDLSDALNALVVEKGGEGVVELGLRPTNCATNYLFPLTVLPFFPGCGQLTVTGRVVARTAAAARGGQP